MKLPSDLDGVRLARRLSRLGYQLVRQTGSHMRLTTLESGVHHVTVPRHSPLKTGTLSAILKEVATHFGLSREELLQRLLDCYES